MVIDWPFITHVLVGTTRASRAFRVGSVVQCLLGLHEMVTFPCLETDEIRTRSTHLPKSSSHDVRFHLSAIDWRTFLGSFFLLVRLISSLLRIPMTSRYCRCYCVLLIPSFFFDFFLVFHTQYACAQSLGIIRVFTVDSVSR